MKAYRLISALLFFYLLLSVKAGAMRSWDSQHEDSQHADHPAKGQKNHQPPSPQSQDSMQDMQDMPGMQHEMHMQPENFIDEILHHQTAGTTPDPNSVVEP